MIAWKYEYNKRVEKLCLNIAGLLPKRLVYWCFIKVFAESGEPPDNLDFASASNYWRKKYKFN